MTTSEDFPGDPGVRTVASTAGDMGSIPWLANQDSTCHGAQPKNKNPNDYDLNERSFEIISKICVFPAVLYNRQELKNSNCSLK